MGHQDSEREQTSVCLVLKALAECQSAYAALISRVQTKDRRGDDNNCYLTPTVTLNSLCHTFNVDGRLRSTSIGSSSGIQDFLSVDQHEYIPGTLSEGLKIILHQPGEPVIPSQQGLGVASCSGQTSTVLVKDRS